MGYQQLLDRIRKDRRDLLGMSRLIEGMNSHGLDAVIAVSSTNVVYTGGALLPTMHSPGHLVFVVTSSDAEQGVVIGEADYGFFASTSWIQDVRPYPLGKDLTSANQEAARRLGKMIQDMGLDGKVGIERSYVPQLYLEALQKSCPNTQLVDGTDVFEYARLVKTPAEIDVFRAAAYYTDKAILTSFALAKVGDTERDVASRMRAIALELGADDLVHAHFQTGVHSTVVHAWPTDIPIKPGEVFHVDTGAVFGGYRTDLARNAVVEVATRRQEEMYRHMWEIQQIVLERMRPGAVARDLFELAQKEFKKVGLIYPWGTLGHSTGITGHEGFEITADSDQVLESGMLVNIEPSHIEDDDARYHIEDTILITEGEPEILSCFADTERLFVIK